MWIPEVFWWWKNTSMGSPRSSQVDVPSLVAKVHHPLWRTPNWIVSHPALEAVLVGHAATIVRKNLPHHLQALCACLYFWGTPRPQALHLKPLKPQLSSCFDGRLFGGKCLLTKIHESIFRWSNHGKSMEIPTADGEICMSLLVTSSSMTMCIFILKSPKKNDSLWLGQLSSFSMFSHPQVSIRACGQPGCASRPRRHRSTDSSVLVATNVIKAIVRHPQFSHLYGCFKSSKYGWFMTLLYQHWLYIYTHSIVYNDIYHTIFCILTYSV